MKNHTRILARTTISLLRKRIKLDTQVLREEVLQSLKTLFDLATGISNSENKEIESRERQAWAKIAAYIAQVMTTLATSFDEKTVDKELMQLELMINEAKSKSKAKRLDGQAAS